MRERGQHVVEGRDGGPAALRRGGEKVADRRARPARARWRPRISARRRDIARARADRRRREGARSGRWRLETMSVHMAPPPPNCRALAAAGARAQALCSSAAISTSRSSTARSDSVGSSRGRPRRVELISSPERLSRPELSSSQKPSSAHARGQSLIRIVAVRQIEMKAIAAVAESGLRQILARRVGARDADDGAGGADLDLEAIARPQAVIDPAGDPPAARTVDIAREFPRRCA